MSWDEHSIQEDAPLLRLLLGGTTFGERLEALHGANVVLVGAGSQDDVCDSLEGRIEDGEGDVLVGGVALHGAQDGEEHLLKEIGIEAATSRTDGSACCRASRCTLSESEP